MNISMTKTPQQKLDHFNDFCLKVRPAMERAGPIRKGILTLRYRKYCFASKIMDNETKNIGRIYADAGERFKTVENISREFYNAYFDLDGTGRTSAIEKLSREVERLVSTIGKIDGWRASNGTYVIEGEAASAESAEIEKFVGFYRDTYQKMKETHGLKRLWTKLVHGKYCFASEIRDANMEQMRDVFHDIKGPLNSVNGFTELFAPQNGEYNDGEILKMIGYVAKSAKNASEIISTVDAWRKAGRMCVRAEKLDIAKIILSQISIFEKASALKRISIVHSMPKGLEVHADRIMVARIVQNLISNAIKFTPKGGKITVSANADGEHVRITVEDTGIGISAESLGKLFVNGFTTDGTEGEKGTGRGLSMVKRFSEANKGNVSVDSTVGVGTKFTVTLSMRGA